MLAGFDGVLLGGQTEGVVAHGVEHVEALHPLVAADDVGGGVALGVADMQARTAGVGKHVEHVVLGLGGIEALVTRAGGAEGLLGVPALLPLGLEFAEREGGFGGHGEGSVVKGWGAGIWALGPRMKRGKPCPRPQVLGPGLRWAESSPQAAVRLPVR